MATSVGAEDDAIASWCAANGAACVRGSRDDVLARFVDALEKHPSATAVRVTADCPLLDVDVLVDLHAALERSGADYASIAPPWPLGLASEAFRVAALREVERLTAGGSPEFLAAREHVTLWLYRRPDLFRSVTVERRHPFDEPLPRLTLDEEEDYALLREVVARFPTGANPSSAELADLFRREPRLRLVNARVAQRVVPSR